MTGIVGKAGMKLEERGKKNKGRSRKKRRANVKAEEEKDDERGGNERERMMANGNERRAIEI